ncbi:MAG TPA: malto-oligosyltrehalose synthase [Streptosporangiaceae bacterium]|nr:malto-oligosyltrehalose synthase [Streptosporangiaceae bacterium]
MADRRRPVLTGGDRPPGPPRSTYRLQLTADFGFAAAGELAGYLADLGVTHAYLSPILQAAPGSRHGYDVVDHSRVSADLGGEDAFRAMVAQFRAHGLGVVVDIVPNHMAVPVPESVNRQLWSMLAEGPESEYASWFDVDWAAQAGRFLLPILAGPPEECLADLAVSEDGAVSDHKPVLRYYEHVLPLRAGTEHLPLPELLDAQHYRLADWRDASAELNWRRFFDVTSLIGIRVEDPAVFAATHEVLLRLIAEGLIDALRVDHPDGLADPRQYLDRLAEATGDAFWVVVEKILELDERLPADWRCAGTTGYDTLNLVDGLFVDPAAAGPPGEFAAVAAVAKREVAGRMFAAEVSRLARLLGGDTADMHLVLTELLAAFGVYRAYLVPGEKPSEVAVRAMTAAADQARTRLPARLHPVLDEVRAAALGDGPDEFVIRFQQTTGPVLAKGVEDTACYRWSRLVSLDEVGGDPDRFGVSPAEFHQAARHLADEWPATMTTLSTHDTKRQEDVRARIAVLAEHDPAKQIATWRELTGPGPGGDIDQLIWQTIIGAWPISADRLDEYLTKAMREAKTGTSWTDPNQEYEATVLAFGRKALEAPVGAFVDQIAPDARVNSLGAKLIQLTMPGVPDVYQGCELAGFALVDPDNRRPVDFARARSPLDEEKFLVTTGALRLRRDRPDWFAAGYTPLSAVGPAAEHVVAFARVSAVTVATRLPAGLRARGGWGETALTLPPTSTWRDVLTGATYPGNEPLRLSDLTSHLPVALLEAQ